MAYQRVPNTVQCDVLFLLFGQVMENVYYVKFDGGVDAVAIADAANTIGAWVLDSWLAHQSFNVQFTGVEAKNLDIEFGSIATFTPTSPAFGVIGVAAEPGNVSYSVSLRTANSGRSFRGRKYVIGIPSTSRTGNQVSSGWATDIKASLDVLRSLLESINGVLSVVSRIAEGVRRLEALSTPVTSISLVDFNIDSQRRRLTGRGT
jgi:hypothetical protein